MLDRLHSLALDAGVRMSPPSPPPITSTSTSTISPRMLRAGIVARDARRGRPVWWPPFGIGDPMRVAYFDESDHTVNRLPRIVSTNGGLASRRPAMRQGRYWAVGMAEGDGGWGDEKSGATCKFAVAEACVFVANGGFFLPDGKALITPSPVWPCAGEGQGWGSFAGG